MGHEVIRLFRRRKPVEAPLLSDAEMAELHEEIFEEPLSIERLFVIYDAARLRGANSRDHEWVMDGRMFNRIQRLCADGYAYFAPPPPETVIQLIGLPIAVEALAKLEIRERVVL